MPSHFRWWFISELCYIKRKLGAKEKQTTSCGYVLALWRILTLHLLMNSSLQITFLPATESGSTYTTLKINSSCYGNTLQKSTYDLCLSPALHTFQRGIISRKEKKSSFSCFYACCCKVMLHNWKPNQYWVHTFEDKYLFKGPLKYWKIKIFYPGKWDFLKIILCTYISKTFKAPKLCTCYLLPEDWLDGHWLSVFISLVEVLNFIKITVAALLVMRSLLQLRCAISIFLPIQKLFLFKKEPNELFLEILSMKL